MTKTARAYLNVEHNAASKNNTDNLKRKNLPENSKK